MKTVMASFAQFLFNSILGLALVIIFDVYCVKGIGIRSCSDPYFPAFGLNTVRYSVSLRIDFE